MFPESWKGPECSDVLLLITVAVWIEGSRLSCACHQGGPLHSIVCSETPRSSFLLNEGYAAPCETCMHHCMMGIEWPMQSSLSCHTSKINYRCLRHTSDGAGPYQLRMCAINHTLRNECHSRTPQLFMMTFERQGEELRDPCNCRHPLAIKVLPMLLVK